LYIEEKQKLYDAQDAILQPLTNKRAMLEKQLNSIPPADRGRSPRRLLKLKRKLTT